MNKQDMIEQRAIQWVKDNSKRYPRLPKDYEIVDYLLALVKREPTLTLGEIEDCIKYALPTFWNGATGNHIMKSIKKKLAEKEEKERMFDVSLREDIGVSGIIWVKKSHKDMKVGDVFREKDSDGVYWYYKVLSKDGIGFVTKMVDR